MGTYLDVHRVGAFEQPDSNAEKPAGIVDDLITQDALVPHVLRPTEGATRVQLRRGLLVALYTRRDRKLTVLLGHKLSDPADAQLEPVHVASP